MESSKKNYKEFVRARALELQQDIKRLMLESSIKKVPLRTAKAMFKFNYDLYMELCDGGSV